MVFAGNFSELFPKGIQNLLSGASGGSVVCVKEGKNLQGLLAPWNQPATQAVLCITELTADNYLR